MCTLIICRRPNSDWPVIVAANRDEMAGRPWLAPARHWPDRAEVVAGLDQLAGGSWMGVNDHGLFAGILNRMGTLGPAPGKRSRGELVLDALDHADASLAAQALADLDSRSWRPFNMVVADNRDAFWIKACGHARVTVAPIPTGVHMLTAYDLDDRTSPRVATYLPRFQGATIPEPGRGEWADWIALMGDPGEDSDGEEHAAMCFTRADGFGTMSSSLIALPADNLTTRPLWLFSPGKPRDAQYTPIV
ncbi:MAG: NRDE family protein [Alphaproteobacteria bacterium]|nr:NRDE family protein [Alphaproteobacteria bacterium]